MEKRTKLSRSEMRTWKNLVGHGIYLFLYSFVKNWSFPFSNYFRFLVTRIFSERLNSTYISDGVTIWFPWNFKIGNRSSLNQGVIINATGGIEIGNGVRIAAYTCINSTDHDFSNADQFIVDQGFITAKVVIEDDVWIGTGVHINRGVRIGQGSVIGSGSVVTKDIPPYSIAVGVPCEVIKLRKS